MAARSRALVWMAVLGAVALAAAAPAQDEIVQRKDGKEETWRGRIISLDEALQEAIIEVGPGKRPGIPFEEIVALSSGNSEIQERWRELIRGRRGDTPPGGDGQGPTERRPTTGLDPNLDEPPDRDTAEAIQALIDRLGGADPSVEEELLRTYGRQATSLLIPALESPNDYQRRAACRVLGRLGDARARPGLLARLRDDQEWSVQYQAAVALRQWADQPEVRDTFLRCAVREEHSQVLKALLLPLVRDQVADTSLRTRLRADALIATDAARRYYHVALAQLGDAAVAGDLRERLEDGGADDILVARALAHLESGRAPALAHLMSVLRNSSDDPDRLREALEALDEVTGQNLGLQVEKEDNELQALRQAADRYLEWWDQQRQTQTQK